MQMDAGLDTGNILSTQSCEITKQDTSLTLTNKLLSISQNLIIKVIDNIEHFIENSIDQTTIINPPVTYAKKITKQEAQINWHNFAEVISQKARAFYPFPGAYCFISEQIRVKIIEIDTYKNNTFKQKTETNTTPGTIIEINKNYLLIKTIDNDTYIKISKLQLPGTKTLNISDILNSNYKELFKINNKFI